ncbi:MAG: Ig-like domain-containing protein [Gemmatimonadota bacterium]
MLVPSRSMALLACLLAGVSVSAAAQNVTELYVTPDTLSLKVGQREGLSVQAFDNVGNAILRISYRSSDERIVRVQPNGTVTALHAGSANVVVQAGRKSHAVRVLVVDSAPPPDSTIHTATDSHPVASSTSSAPVQPAAASGVSTLGIEPATIYLLPAENVRAVAHALRADGSPIAQPRVGWKSLRPEIATVGDTSGVVVGAAAGQGLVQAIAGGVTATAPVVVALTEYDLGRSRIVLAPEEAETLHVTVPAQQGRLLRNADLQWTSTDPAIVQIGPDGIVHALAPGRAEVVVSGFLQEHRVPIVVHREVTGFVTRPRLGETIQLPLRATREIKVRAEAADSTAVPEAMFDWSLSDSSVASFDTATGVLLAKKLGTTTLSFVMKGFVPKAWTITVVPGIIAVDRQRVGLSPGGSTRLNAMSMDLDGKPVGPAQGVVWSSSSTAVASVGTDGEIEALSPGVATITATAPGAQPVTAQLFVVADLLFSSTRDGKYGVYGLQLRAPSTFLRILSDSFSNVQAEYSPDHTRLLLSSDRSGPSNYDIFVLDADGRNPTRLTSDPGLDNQPEWMPDGRQIIFASSRSGTGQLYLMNADGSEAHALTAVPGGNGDPDVSPDGKRIAFTSGRDGNSEIYLMNSDGTGQTNMTLSKDRRETAPSFLPDGDLVYLLERRDGPTHYQVVRQTASGTKTPLVESELPITYYSVSRDGTMIAYVCKAKKEGEYLFYLQPVAGGAAVSVPLQPGEKIASPAF